MKIFTKHILLGLLFICANVVVLDAQRTITGSVKGDDGGPIPSAKVAVKGTNIATLTDFEGNFSLNAPEKGTLEISSVGFTTQEIEIGANTTIAVVLATDVKQLGEVLVTSAYGVKRAEKSLTYSVQQISNTDIERANDQNVVSAMQGKIAGAFIQTSSGAPGAGANILLRGINSINPNGDNQPLIVVDGVFTSNATNVSNVLPSAGSNNLGGSAEQFSNTNRLADINPNDIESVSVLKGPAATALYGSLAQNGAIIITTKKGTTDGKAKITFSTTYSIDEVNKTPPIQRLFREGNLGRIRVNPDNTVQATRFQDFGPPILGNPIYDNFQGIFTQGSRLVNNLSVAGGNQSFTYLVSGSTTNHQGIFPTSKYDRSTLRMNAGYQALKWLNLSGAFGYTNTSTRNPNGGDKSVMSALSYHSNTFDVNDYINPDGSMRSYAGTVIDNPRWLGEFAPYTTKVNRFNTFVKAEAKLTDWANISYQIGLDQYTDVRKRVMPGGTDVGSQVSGFVVDESINNRDLTSNLLARFTKDFSEDFTASLLLGNSILDKRFEDIGMRGEGLVMPQFYDITNTTNYFPLYDFEQTRLIGNFANASFTVKKFLNLDASIRNDRTSTLPDGNNSFWYYQLGGNVVLTDAIEISDKLLSFGKIRASYAENGQGTGAYAIGNYFGAAPRFPFGTTPGFRRSPVYGNLNLKPLRTKAFEIGADLRFYKDRFGIDITYYTSTTQDQILSVPVSNATGFSNFVTNSGVIKNKGVEVSLNVTPIKTADFKWNTRINFSRVRGNVESIAEGIDRVVIFDGAWVVSQLIPGGNTGDLYGYNFSRDSISGLLRVGNDGYPIIDQTRLVKVGNALPNFLSALINEFSYKGLTISGQLEWKNGGDVYDMGMRNAIRNGNIKQTERRSEVVIFKGIKPDGTPNTTPVDLDGEGFFRSAGRYNAASEILLQDASWWRLRNINISYRLPKSALSSLPFANIAISVIGNNLWLNTPYVGFDPEAMANGAGSNSYGFAGLTMPSTRSFSVGLNLTFK